MWYVKEKTTGETVAICSQLADATALVRAGNIDKKFYILEQHKEKKQ
jgi:hypothetical protein